jgi:hypothetical protein
VLERGGRHASSKRAGPRTATRGCSLVVAGGHGDVPPPAVVVELGSRNSFGAA